MAGCSWWRAYVAGGIHGRGVFVGRHAWWEGCVRGRKMTIAAGSMHPNGMHSCCLDLFLFLSDTSAECEPIEHRTVRTDEFFTNYMKMMVFSSLLCENQNNPVAKCYHQWE